MERDEKINKAMDLLSEHDYVSWYQEAINIVFNYIDYLETELKIYDKAESEEALMNKTISNKLQRGLALTVKESQELYQYIKALEHTVWILSQNVIASQSYKEESENKK